MTMETFYDTWNKHEDFDVAYPESPRLCRYAAKFAVWADYIVSWAMGDEEAGEEPDVVRLNQAMLRLFKKYHDWYSVVPKSHRERIGDRGHPCIFHVMKAYYDRLRAAELALTPPLLFRPQRSAPEAPPPVRMPALFFGEFEEERRDE
jgi:hypothetical protein